MVNVLVPFATSGFLHLYDVAFATIAEESRTALRIDDSQPIELLGYAEGSGNKPRLRTARPQGIRQSEAAHEVPDANFAQSIYSHR